VRSRRWGRLRRWTRPRHREAGPALPEGFELRKRRQVHAFLIGEVDELGPHSETTFFRGSGISDLSAHVHCDEYALPFDRLGRSVEEFESGPQRGDVDHPTVTPALLGVRLHHVGTAPVGELTRQSPSELAHQRLSRRAAWGADRGIGQGIDLRGPEGAGSKDPKWAEGSKGSTQSAFRRSLGRSLTPPLSDVPLLEHVPPSARRLWRRAR